MKPPRMRPVFELPLEDPDALLPALRRTLDEADGSYVATVFKRHAVLEMADSERHFWSPHLYLEVARDDDDEHDDYGGSHDRGPHLHGRFAPHPHVWTLFMAIYGLLTLAGIAGGVWGFSTWMLGQPSWALIAVPAAPALIAFTYGAAFIGQGLGAAQMYELRTIVDRAVEESRAQPEPPLEEA